MRLASRCRHQIEQSARHRRGVESAASPAALDGKHDDSSLARADGDDEPAHLANA
jgi:hypothetical protein